MSAAADVQTTRVQYRPMVWSDIDAIVTAFDDTWGGGDSPAASTLSRQISRHFVLHYLTPSTRGEIAQLDGRFMGVTLSRIPGRPVLFAQAEDSLRAIDAALADTASGSAALRSVRYWHDVERHLESDCGVDDDAYAELELFMVVSQARGHGVGGGLWNRVLDDFDRQGMRHCFLHTDSECDVGFYDHYGMRRALARMSADHPEDVRLGGERLDDLFIYTAQPGAMLENLRGAAAVRAASSDLGTVSQTGAGPHGAGSQSGLRR